MLDVKRLIGEVAARNGIRVESWDPAFALVTLNELVLEEIARQLTEEVHSGIAEFTEAVQKTETRAGKLLAQQVREASAEVRRELQRDIEDARLRASEIVLDVHRAHRKPAVIRWGAAGLIAGAGLFGSGLWIGAHYLH
ncbi:MAG TPA: hypothetical protein VKX49_25150 [Bryobacteraceae bacterium]|nr:hypothetical protein [Bryobacteraceae bacterium]